MARAALAAGLCAAGRTGLPQLTLGRMAPHGARRYRISTTASPWQIRVRGLGVITNDSRLRRTACPGSDLSAIRTRSSRNRHHLLLHRQRRGRTHPRHHLCQCACGWRDQGVRPGRQGLAAAAHADPAVPLHRFRRVQTLCRGRACNYSSLFYEQSGSRLGFSNLDVKNHFGAAPAGRLRLYAGRQLGASTSTSKRFSSKPTGQLITSTLGPLQRQGQDRSPADRAVPGITYRFLTRASGAARAWPPCAQGCRERVPHGILSVP